MKFEIFSSFDTLGSERVNVILSKIKFNKILTYDGFALLNASINFILLTGPLVCVFVCLFVCFTSEVIRTPLLITRGVAVHAKPKLWRLLAQQLLFKRTNPDCVLELFNFLLHKYIAITWHHSIKL